jgi:hypothetical protein
MTAHPYFLSSKVGRLSDGVRAEAYGGDRDISYGVEISPTPSWPASPEGPDSMESV